MELLLAHGADIELYNKVKKKILFLLRIITPIILTLYLFQVNEFEVNK